MADKPSNNRKKVSYEPARDGHAARWKIEERTGPSSRKGTAKERTVREQASQKRAPREQAPRNQRERARARVEEHKRERADRPASPERPIEKKGGSTARTREQRKPAGASARARAGERAPERRAAKPERVVADNPQRARHVSSDRTRSHVMEAMMPRTSGSSSASTVFGLPMRTVLIAALLLVIVVFFLWHPWSQGTEAASPDPGEEAPPSDILEERFATMPDYGTVAPVDFNAVEEDGFTAGFVLVHGGEVTDYSIYDTEPELSDESAQVLNEALQPFSENDAIAAFLLMDIKTGRGFARNIDKTIYGASSFKGPYCGYLLKKYVDGGDTELTDSFSSGYMNSALAYVRSGTDSLENLVEETIVDSSNDAFASLRVNFSDRTLAEWLSSVNVDEHVAYDTWFPFNTVRNMAKLWMETYYYLQTNSEAASMLRECMNTTTTSFMREALTGVKALKEESVLVEEAATESAENNESEASTDAAEGEGADDASELEEASTLKVTGSVGKNLANTMEHSIDVMMAPDITVLDKAGWNIDPDENYDALVDCGIVSCNGRDYLLCAMTDVAYTDSNVEDFEKLIAAVFNARQDLA